MAEKKVIKGSGASHPVPSGKLRPDPKTANSRKVTSLNPKKS